MRGFYQAGIAVVIALAAVYAEQVLGFKQTQTMMLIFLVNIAVGAGGLCLRLLERPGRPPAGAAATLWGWVVMTLLAVAATTPALFWLAAVVAGCAWAAASRPAAQWPGLFAPADRLAEFYGLWTFAVRLSAIVGPITYGLVTLLTGGNHRLAILSTGFLPGRPRGPAPCRRGPRQRRRPGAD